jgi:putative restriction endonuclease
LLSWSVDLFRENLRISLDPFLQQRGIRGLEHGAKGEEEVWNEFAKNPEALTFESEKLLAEREGKSVEEVAQIETDDLPPPGKEREAIVRVRVNQKFFRRRVLSALMVFAAA